MLEQLALCPLHATACRLELRERRLYVIRHLSLGFGDLSLLCRQIGPGFDDLALEAIENGRRQRESKAEGRRVDGALVGTLPAHPGGQLDVGET